MSGICNFRSAMGDAWYVMTLVYLVSPLVCVYVCVLLYRGTQKYIQEVLSVLMGRKIIFKKIYIYEYWNNNITS